MTAGFLWMALTGLVLGLHQGSWGLNPGANILLSTTVASGLASFALTLPFHLLRHPLARLPECALLLAPWVVLLRDHRQGHLDQPLHIIEPIWASGVDPTRLFIWLGLVLGLQVVLLLASRSTRGASAPSLVLVALASLVCAALVPTVQLTRVGATASQSVTLPDSQSVSQQRSDTPVAVVVLYQDYQPEQGFYHFAVQSDPTDIEPNVPQAVSQRYRVAELKRQPEHLILGWSPQLLPAAAANQNRFARIYEVRSQTLAKPLSELLSLEAAASRTTSNEGSRRLAHEIVPAEERAMPLRAALRVKFWMEQNRAQSVNAPEDSGSIEECLEKGEPVGQKTYTLAAESLLEALGLTFRRVQGYAVSADQRGEGSFLLLTEAHRRWWLEVWLPGEGWAVIDLYPVDGPSSTATGPANQELQRQLGELARARKETGNPLPGLGAGALGMMLSLVILLAGGHGIRMYRSLRRLWCPAHCLPTYSYLAVLDRLAEVGEVRRTGETRLEFAERLKDRVPSLKPLTQLLQQSRFGPPLAARAFDQSRPLASACLGELQRAFPLHRRAVGRLHPFAWMKVV